MTSTNETLPTYIPVPDTFWGRMDSPRWGANAERAAAAGLTPCTVCGRGINAKTAWTVTVAGGGGFIFRADVDVDTEDPGFMGAWDLGPECAKTIPVAFRTLAGAK